jgi:hypothetical protein
MQLSPSLTPWTTSTTWLNSFVSSAQNFAPDYTATFSVSHPQKNGVVTTGSYDWDNYAVASRITFSQQTAGGLVARARGHRRYYAAVLTGGSAAIMKRRDQATLLLASSPFDYRIDDTYTLEFRADGPRLSLLIDGQACAHAFDGEYPAGGAGFLVEEGALVCDGFAVRRV